MPNVLLPPLDSDGYLLDRQQWTPAVADTMAASEGVALTPQHWQVIDAIRGFYQRFDHAPNNRALTNHVSRTVGPELGNSTTLMILFGQTPAKTAARWAGLPKPAHCL